MTEPARMTPGQIVWHIGRHAHHVPGPGLGQLRSGPPQDRHA